MSKIYLSQILLFLLCSPITLIVGQSFITETASIPAQEALPERINVDITLNILVVLMELSDDPHHETHTVQHFTDLFFSRNFFIVFLLPFTISRCPSNKSK